MYVLRKNTHAEAPGLWTTADGEYSFTRTPEGWVVRRRDAQTGTGIVGIVRTLNGALALASRHYTKGEVTVTTPRRFKVGDRVRTVRYYGSAETEAATVIEIRTGDYIIRYDRAGKRHEGDFQTVGRTEGNLTPEPSN